MTVQPKRAAPNPLLTQPSLDTPRLLLRPFEMHDAPTVQKLAGAFEVADTTLNIPHPYRDGAAEAWIMTHNQLYRAGALVNFAIVLRQDDQLIGAVGLRLHPNHQRGEIGYWIGSPYWRLGYCTEAAAAVLAYGFNVLGLHRIHAAHFRRNAASGRVMQKLGMRHEGRFREHVRKWDVFEDLEEYAILRSEYLARAISR
jgi:RimJ/RimL family protein N-acetyltransferase